ncbi:MAG: OmpA family protein [Prolixibacteraceae bacterium]|nr:OmpA family protein [Prolixibacteraceae bacterium]
MKKIFTLWLLFFFSYFSFAAETLLEEVNVPGIVNPQSFYISPDGLKMIIVDLPKKGVISVKQAIKPYLNSPWGAADEISSINKLITEKVKADAPCISYDGKYLYFSANFSDSKGGMDIYYCMLENGKWSAPVNIGGLINTEENESCPSISGNNREFVFTRSVKIKKLEEYNTGEIWTSSLDSASLNWIQPSKLNTEINQGGISYPKIYDDNKTILFSRVIDEKVRWEICWTKKLGDIHWYLPVEIDTVNSKNSDICPVYCHADKYIYFLVNESSDNRPDNNIYRFKLLNQFIPEKTITIKGKVINKENNKPVEANILAFDPLLSRIKFFTVSDQNTGEWKMLLNSSETLMFHVWQDNYSHKYELFKPPVTDESFSKDFYIFPNTELVLNIYDKEEYWPLDGLISVRDANSKDIPINVKTIFPGKKSFILPIGVDYDIYVQMEDYQTDKLNLPLSNIVLYDKFVRDIELQPERRDVEIYVTDEDTKNPIDAEVVLIDFKRKKKVLPDKVSGHTGLSKISLREGEKFDVEVRGPKGYTFNHAILDLKEARELKRLNIELKPLKIKVAIRLNNINFEFNSADLIESSHEELNRVIQLIKDNPEIKIEIMAHTDDKGTDKYNDVLADKRAKSVVDYLVSNGADGNRLIARGYGESMPLVPNDTEENRAINRRVEMKILDYEESIIPE